MQNINAYNTHYAQTRFTTTHPKSRGTTLYELTITLFISSLLFGFALPSYLHLSDKIHTRTAMYSILEAIETTRTTAVLKNCRVVLLAKNKQWGEGWTIFVDKNNNGHLDNNESILNSQEALKRVVILANKPVQSLVSFIGTGESTYPGKANSGAFLAGTIKVCPQKMGDGYALVLSRGGRTRVKPLSASECSF